MNVAAATDVGPRLGLLLGPLRRAVLRLTRAAADLPDLPEAQIELLRLLVATDGITPRRTAARLKVAPSTVSNLIRTMVDSDLVRRQASTTDLRTVTLIASPKAHELLDRYDRASGAMLRDAVTRLSDDEQRALEQALPALTHLLAILTV